MIYYIISILCPSVKNTLPTKAELYYVADQVTLPAQVDACHKKSNYWENQESVQFTYNSIQLQL